MLLSVTERPPPERILRVGPPNEAFVLGSDMHFVADRSIAPEVKSCLQSNASQTEPAPQSIARTDPSEAVENSPAIDPILL